MQIEELNKKLEEANNRADEAEAKVTELQVKLQYKAIYNGFMTQSMRHKICSRILYHITHVI